MAQPAVMQCTRGNKKMEALQPCQTIRPNQANMKTIGGRLVFFLLLRFSLLLFPVLMKCLYGTRLYSRSAVHQQPEPKRRDVRWARIQEQQQQQPQQTAHRHSSNKKRLSFSRLFFFPFTLSSDLKSVILFTGLQAAQYTKKEHLL